MYVLFIYIYIYCIAKSVELASRLREYITYIHRNKDIFFKEKKTDEAMLYILLIIIL